MTEPTGSAGGPGRDSADNGDDPFAGLFRDRPRADPRARDDQGEGPGQGRGQDWGPSQQGGQPTGRPGDFGGDSRWGGSARQLPPAPQQQPQSQLQPWSPGTDRNEPGDYDYGDSGSGGPNWPGGQSGQRGQRGQGGQDNQGGASWAGDQSNQGGPSWADGQGGQSGPRERSGMGGQDRQGGPSWASGQGGQGDQGGPSYSNDPYSSGPYPTEPFAVHQSPQQAPRPSMHEQTGITPVIRGDHDDYDDFANYGDYSRDDDDNGNGNGGSSNNNNNDYRNDGWEPATTPEPKRGKKKALVATGALGTVAVVAVAVVLVTQGGVSPGAAGHRQAGAAPTPTPTVGYAPNGASAAEDAAQTASVFFRAWQSGDFKSAANYTDDPAAALTALQSYTTNLGATTVNITPLAPSASASASTSAAATPTTKAGAGGATDGASATASAIPSGTQNFSVSVVVAPPTAAAAGSTSGASAGPTTSASGAATGSGTGAGSASASTATWTYSSTLTAYEQKGRWYVKWAPTVIAPNITADEHLATVSVPPGASEVTDASGNNLSKYSDPAITSIISYLKQHIPAGAGTPGVAVELVDATGKAVSGSEDVIKPPVNVPSIATTIDSHTEKLALQAVQHKTGSSLVVIQPSTGAILAVANNDGGKDDALGSREAPGSTMKIVTAAALFNYGVLTPATPVACPSTNTIQGVTYHNSEGDEEPPGTPFLIDFAQSCNNAFDSQYVNLGNLRLEGTAVRTFGLNQPWNIGLGPATYFTMPTDSSNESGSELAQEAFGQGKVSASPLAMASVAATVQTGNFHQPYLVSSISDKVTADPMPSTTQSDLKKVMRAVISNPLGTAYGIPFASDVYAKTGTAEHGPENMSPNAWFAAVDPNHDVAACALVLDNTMNQDNYGATNAAPEVLTVFDGL